MKFIQPAGISNPRGHYTPAVVENGFVFVSGQLPMDSEGNVLKGTVEEQMLQCLRNIDLILQASGSSISRVVKATVFITDISDWPKVNAVFANYFGDHRPARVAVPTGKLLEGIHVEVDCISVVK
ncbi:MAG: RidA family protein [Cyclobacteriaceae bacterium]|nr:RidA family protein [Cyclobacteriaceae bacterium]